VRESGAPVVTDMRASLYTWVLLLHSWLRWVVLVTAVGATAGALRKGQPGLRQAESWGKWLTISIDTQLLLGILLYVFLSPFVTVAMRGFGDAMRDPVLRFWAVEHVTMMVAAVVLVHVGRVLGRKAVGVEQKRARLLVCFGLALLLMLGGMPWPGMPAGRPLFRF
jgi:hypothetical protein